MPVPTADRPRAAVAADRPTGTADEQAQSELAALRELLDPDPEVLEALGLSIPPPGDHVTAVLVSHDGARWLPQALAGLAAQTRPPDRVVAVDTGSNDGSVELLQAALGSDVVRAGATTGFGAAVAQALGAATGQGAGDEPSWIWLLHDDCAPEPTALEELLRATATTRNVGLLGPKARDWDDPRLLVEVGLSVDRSGRRVTSLDAGEFDQGQHDAQRDVLAVPTAGALVRRDSWERVGGLDPGLPLFRDDIDLGWRVTRAGQRVVVVPSAVVRHARAAATGRRHADAAPGIARRVDRRHALLVALANSSTAALVLGLPRAVVAAGVRALGYLLTRRPHLAADEMAAAATALRPGRLRQARRWRRQHGADRDRPAGADAVVRSLLVPRGARLRAGVGVVGDWLTSGSPPAPVAGVEESGPVSEDAELLPADDIGRVRRALTRPWLLLTVATTALALIADRHLDGSGELVGGRLLPSGVTARTLWRDYASTWHLGTLSGSPTPSPPWTPVVALAGSICAGRVGLAVGLLMLLAVPLAVLSGYVATRGTGLSQPARVWGALTYGLAPVVTGSVAGGRFDAVVALVALPLLARGTVALVLAARHRAAWRRAWALGLGLGVVAAFSPPVWSLAAAALGLAALARLVTGSPKAALRLLVPLLPAPALSLPWLPRLAQDPGVLLTGLGRPGGLAGQPAVAAPDGPRLLALTPSSTGGYPSHWWLLPVLLVALAGLVTTQSRRRWTVTASWAAALLGLAGAVVVERVRVTATDLPQRGWPGPALGLVALALVLAALLATGDLRARLAARTFGLRQVAAVLLVVLAAPVPVALGVRWAVHGSGTPLQRRVIAALPPDVLSDAAAALPGERVLILQRLASGTVDWSLGRLDGPRLGDEEQVPDVRSTGVVTAAVRDLATARGTDAAELLSTFDVHVIAVVGAGRSALTAALDTQPALSRRATAGYDLALWQLTIPTARAQILDSALSDVALHPAPLATGVGRGPSRLLVRQFPPVAIPAGEEGLAVTIPAGGPGRVLVLADARDSGWRATLAGRPLPAATAWGWAQAYVLPSGGGQLRVTRDASSRHLLIGLQAVALALVLILAAPTLGRDRTGRDGVDEPAPLVRRSRAAGAQTAAEDDEDALGTDRLARLRQGRLA